MACVRAIVRRVGHGRDSWAIRRRIACAGLPRRVQQCSRCSRWLRRADRPEINSTLACRTTATAWLPIGSCTRGSENAHACISSSDSGAWGGPIFRGAISTASMPCDGRISAAASSWELSQAMFDTHSFIFGPRFALAIDELPNRRNVLPRRKHNGRGRRKVCKPSVHVVPGRRLILGERVFQSKQRRATSAVKTGSVAKFTSGSPACSSNFQIAPQPAHVVELKNAAVVGPVEFAVQQIVK